MFGSSEKQLCIAYNDFNLSILATRQNDLHKGLTYQIPLEEGVVINGIIEDETAFFKQIKSLFKKLKLKKNNVRFFVPSQFALMRKVPLPDEMSEEEEIREYIESELDVSIRLPFEEAIVDTFVDTPLNHEVRVFATEQQEIDKLMDIFYDLGHYPEVADLRILSDLRVLDSVYDDLEENTTLVLDWSMNELTLAILDQGHVEIVKQHRIETEFTDWQMEKVADDEVNIQLVDNIVPYEKEIARVFEEIEKVVHFFQFSLNKGNREVTRIINVGEHPMLGDITELLQSNVTFEVKQLKDEEMDARFPTYRAKDIALIGLAIKKEENK